MKKKFLTIAIFITVNNFGFSQEEQVENKNPKSPSRIGGSVGSGINLAEFLTEHNDVRVDIFYHKTLSKFRFLSYNVGYIDCVGRNSFIPITVGINFFYPNNYIVPYYGFEIGISMDDRNIGFLLGSRSGIYVPIPKLNICLGFGFTAQLASNGTGFLSANWTISYLLP